MCEFCKQYMSTVQHNSVDAICIITVHSKTKVCQ